MTDARLVCVPVCDPTPTDPDAELAKEALPAALAAYVRAARALRAARLDFSATLAAAKESPCERAEAAKPEGIFAPAALESLFGAMNIARHEAEHLTTYATAIGKIAVDSGALSGHEVNVCLARGQAREMLTCACGNCDVCACRLSAERLDAEGKVGRGALGELTASILRKLEPSGLVGLSGAPLECPPGANRHQRRATKART